MWTAVVLRSLATIGLVARAKLHNSLTDLGIATAFVTAVIHSIHPWSVSLILITAFFLSSTKFTKYKHEIKANLTSLAGAKEEGPRNHVQVLANSVIASAAILISLTTGANWIMFGVIANYAAVTADTWSSELGILSKGQPLLITTLRPCPKGTNGGVSPLGFGVAFAGGIFIGVVSIAVCPLFWDMSIGSKLVNLLYIGFLGLAGSVLDSLLGAVFQKSVINKEGKIVEAVNGAKLDTAELRGAFKVHSGKIDLLSNNQVNLAMAGITSLVGTVVWKLFFY